LAKQGSCASVAEYPGEYEAWRRAAMRAIAYYKERKQSNYDAMKMSKLGGG